MELQDHWINMFNYKIWHIGRPKGLPSKDACHRLPGFNSLGEKQMIDSHKLPSKLNTWAMAWASLPNSTNK